MLTFFETYSRIKASQVLMNCGRISYLLTATLILYCRVVFAQTSAFTYQGRLSVSGVPATGVYDLQFGIYNSAIGGTIAGNLLTNAATPVTNGLFVVPLNFGSASFDGSDRWLEIGARIAGSASPFTLLSPRQSITAIPYAVRAANYSGPVGASQISGLVPVGQLAGTLGDAQLSTNVPRLNASQSFTAANKFLSPDNAFAGNGTALTDLNAEQITSGILADERLPASVARLSGTQTVTGNEDDPPSLRLEGPGQNNWLVLSNGSLWLPPNTFPNEDGGDGVRGGIYFGSAGSTGPGNNNNNYILNLVNRGQFGGQMLISHQSIDLEEGYLGEIVLGNDGTAGGLVRIRYEDAFGANLQPGQPGHSHALVFHARNKAANNNIDQAYPSIIAFHGGGPNVFAPDNYGFYGGSGAGALAFYSKTPWSGVNSVLYGGIEMGRMETNGWNFRGTLSYQKASIAPVSVTNYVLDLGTNHYMEITLTSSPTRFTTINPHGGANNVQKATIIIHPGPLTRSVTFPPWKVLSESGSAVLPTTIIALTTMVVNLEILGNGGDTNTLARFLSYKD